MKRVLAFVFAAALCSCASNQGGDPTPHVVPVPADQCAAACDVMNTKLVQADGGVGCEEGKPVQLKDGGSMTCAEFCKYQHDNGIGWNNDCIVNQAKTCEDIESLCNPPK